MEQEEMPYQLTPLQWAEERQRSLAVLERARHLSGGQGQAMKEQGQPGESSLEQGLQHSRDKAKEGTRYPSLTSLVPRWLGRSSSRPCRRRRPTWPWRERRMT